MTMRTEVEALDEEVLSVCCGFASRDVVEKYLYQ